MASAIAARWAAPASDAEIVGALLALKRHFAADLAAAKAMHSEQLAAAQATNAKELTELKASFAAESEVLTRELATARSTLRDTQTLNEAYRQQLVTCATAGQMIAAAVRVLGG
jgi:hypothetical protein